MWLRPTALQGCMANTVLQRCLGPSMFINMRVPYKPGAHSTAPKSCSDARSPTADLWQHSAYTCRYVGTHVAVLRCFQHFQLCVLVVTLPPHLPHIACCATLHQRHLCSHCKPVDMPAGWCSAGRAPSGHAQLWHVSRSRHGSWVAWLARTTCVKLAAPGPSSQQHAGVGRVSFGPSESSLHFVLGLGIRFRGHDDWTSQLGMSRSLSRSKPRHHQP
jgi:hypothetical protein